MQKFTHINQDGALWMVDVSEKERTAREARAIGQIKTSPSVLEAIRSGSGKKGDVLAAARIAGIMGAKKTSDLIPLCHPVPLHQCEVLLELQPGGIQAECRVKTEGKTGAEMEALTGVSMALLTLYDMCKAIDKRMEITGIHLVEKRGGKSGDFVWEE